MKDIIKYIYEFKKLIVSVMAIFGLILLMAILINNNEIGVNKAEIINNWYNQLPEEHFIKKDILAQKLISVNEQYSCLSKVAFKKCGRGNCL